MGFHRALPWAWLAPGGIFLPPRAPLHPRNGSSLHRIPCTEFPALRSQNNLGGFSVLGVAAEVIPWSGSAEIPPRANSHGCTGILGWCWEFPGLFPVPGQGGVTRNVGYIPRAPQKQWEKLEELRLHRSHSPGKGSGHRDWSIPGTKGSPKFRLLPRGRSQHPPGNFVGFLLVF